MHFNNQKTLSSKINLSGIGLHSGNIVDLVIKPAPENFGIKFCRIDINKNDYIAANYQNVVDPVLCTKIKNQNGVSVSTVEHLMAAFFGEGVDNALVEVNSSEIPILDGSANDFVEAIRTAGIKEQNSKREFIKVLKKVEVIDGDKYISIKPLNNDLIVDFEIVYKNPLIRTRRKVFNLSKDNLNEIYSSRTFCLYEDIDLIKNKGLAKGGSLDNAIVVKDDQILNEDGLRNRHEFVYHKILDCLGDLMLSGKRIFGHIKTSQGGHALTNKLLRKFFSNTDNWSLDNGQDKIKNTLSQKDPKSFVASA